MEIFEIAPGLYQSTKIDNVELFLSYGFDTVIDLEGGFDKVLSGWNLGGSYLYWHIFDMPWLPNKDRLWNVAHFGFSAWEHGDKVLIHCSMGRNRSGLIMGCILRLIPMKGPDIVKLIQEKRPGSLTNQIFYDFLSEL